MLSVPRRASAAALAAALLLVPTVAEAKAKAKPDVTFMSRNLYLGADIIKLATSTDEQNEAENVAALFKTVQQTNFPLRAQRIAREIRTYKPDLIGLQEVARYYRGAAGVHDKTTNANTVLYDWLAILQRELKSAGQNYRVAIEQNEMDIETASADGYDLRLRLGNAILVRKGSKVKVTRSFRGIFKNQLSVPVPDQTVTLKRGFAAVDAKVAGKKFRFIDPHAEAYSDEAANGQFKELLATAAKSKKLTTILAGDFNSSPTRGQAYKTVIAAGFWDTGVKAATCCQSETLDNPESQLDPSDWIDHIVIRPKARVLKRAIVGTLQSDRIGGLWPSDHAGLVAKLRLK
jgi:endonuclease/exonuclease/phosphatase family metal-dependent hydrolase